MKGQKTACLQNFVRASAGLTFLGTSENHETFSRKQLHGHGDGTMHLWHLFKEECGMLELVMTLALSPNTQAFPLIGAPRLQRAWRMSMTC